LLANNALVRTSHEFPPPLHRMLANVLNSNAKTLNVRSTMVV